MQDATQMHQAARGGAAPAREGKVPLDPQEAALIARSQGGDLQAFDRLVAAHEDRIYHAAYRITGNADDARDAAQEAFLKAFRALPRYRHESAFSTWLHRIAVNASLDLVRRRPHVPPLPLEDVALPASVGNPEPEAERSDLQRRVHQALGRLPHDHRVIIVLRDLQGLAYEEVAEVLRIPIGTVRSRLSRAREALRVLLIDLAPGSSATEEHS
ncbi:MAG TPA: sigma-70 family RNA polymerase sigma factor [bacterium]|jgi:RNA polymerase sigma-70 factor (ECF subfamily)|nr:sigma-70 family RNA polymerase sigma factor [bacterium]